MLNKLVDIICIWHRWHIFIYILKLWVSAGCPWVKSTRTLFVSLLVPTLMYSLVSFHARAHTHWVRSPVGVAIPSSHHVLYIFLLLTPHSYFPFENRPCMGVCASSVLTRASTRVWRASVWQLLGDGRVTPCARGAYKVGKRPIQHKVANKSALLLWFA